MSKTTCLVVFVSIFVIFSFTDAHPMTESPEPLQNVTENSHLTNNSRLVITNVVKTIEFEVGVLDDDGVVDENSTALNGTDFYETDIQLLNLDLLKEVVDKASEKQNNTTDKP